MTTAANREGETFSAVENFEIITCYECGIPFGVPARWRANRRSDKRHFYCPNGHRQHYSVSTEQRLRNELKHKQDQLNREWERAEQARDQRDKARRKYSRLRERVQQGQCPCCDAVFTNLLEHMRSEHPEIPDSDVLRKLRDSFGLTQDDLAREIGVTPAHISQFECRRQVALWAKDQIEAWIDDVGQTD